MNTETKIAPNITLRDAMVSDSLYYTANHQGNLLTWQSQDRPFNLISNLIAKHDFVEQVSNTEGEVFTFEKTVSQVSLKKSSLLAPQLYEIDFLCRWATPRNCLLSDHFSLFDRTAIDLGFDNAQLTRNPLSSILKDGLLEGELLNTFVSRLRSGSKRKSFKVRADSWRQNLSKINHSFRRYVLRLYENNPNTYVHRLDIGYIPGSFDQSFRSELLSHIQQFTDRLESDFSESICGFWWKREFLSEIGYRYHLIIFSTTMNYFNAQALNNQIVACWNDIAQGNGKCYTPVNYRNIGIGAMGIHSIREALLDSVKLMLKTQSYLILQPFQSFDNFGIGKLPKANPVMPNSFDGATGLYTPFSFKSHGL